MNSLYIVSEESQGLEFEHQLLKINPALKISRISHIHALSEACIGKKNYLVFGDLEGVKALNVGASIKKCSPDSEVALLSLDITNSLKYRATKAHIDKLLSYEEVFTRAQVKEPSCPWISLISPMGGCGVSTIAALLANLSAEEGLSVGLLSLNSSFSPLYQCLCAELEEELDLSNLQGHKGDEILSLAKRVKRKLYLYDLARKPEELELIQSSHTHLLCEAGKLHDLLVLDLANVWSELSASCLKQSERIIVLSEERSYTREQLDKTQKLLSCLEIEQSKIFYLINKSQRKQRDQSFLRSISEVLNTNNLASLSIADAKLEEYARLGQLAEFEESEQKFMSGLKNYGRELLCELGLITAKTSSKGIFDRFRRGAK